MLPPVLMIALDVSRAGGEHPESHSRATWTRSAWSQAGSRLQRRIRSTAAREHWDIPSRAGSRGRP
jgi:hypothetical protein